MARSDSFTKSIQLRVDDAFLEHIDEWLKARGHNWSRSEAIRTLVTMGMKINLGEQEHVNETLQDIHQFLGSVKDGVANADPEKEGLTVIAEALENLDNIDSRLQDFIDNRTMLRKKLAELRTSTIRALKAGAPLWKPKK